MSDSGEVVRPAVSPMESNVTLPYPSAPFCYTLLYQQEAAGLPPTPSQLLQRHTAAQRESPLLCSFPGGVSPLLNLPTAAGPLLFGPVPTAMSSSPAATMLPYSQGFPTGRLSYAVVPKVLPDGMWLKVPDLVTESEISRGKSKKGGVPESDVAIERLHTVAPGTGNAQPHRENKRQFLSPHGETNSAASGATSGDEEDRVMAFKDVPVALARCHSKVASIRGKPRAMASGSNGVSLEKLLKDDAHKRHREEDDRSSEKTKCVIDPSPEEPSSHFRQFYKLFFNSSMSDTLRIRNLATDESGVVVWIEITRRVSRIDPTYGPVDEARIIISSNGLCKLQLTYPFVRTVRTRLMPNAQVEVDELLSDLGPQNVLCPGIHDYEYRFPAFSSHRPVSVRVTDTLNGTKRYDHERCTVWHAPAQSFSVPGRDLHNVCRCCRQLNGMLAKLSAQAGVQKGVVRLVRALSNNIKDDESAHQLVTEVQGSKESCYDGEEEENVESPSSSGACNHVDVEEGEKHDYLCSLPGKCKKFKAS